MTREAELDTLAHELDVREQHDATHGEAEMCGDECISWGLADFDPESWNCVDCGIPLEPGTPPICEECVDL